MPDVLNEWKNNGWGLDASSDGDLNLTGTSFKYNGLDMTTGGGAATFLDLTDAPASYTGSGGKFLAVKGDESGLEFVTGGGGSPGGSDTQVQFNDSNAFGGAPLFYSKTAVLGTNPPFAIGLANDSTLNALIQGQISASQVAVYQTGGSGPIEVDGIGFAVQSFNAFGANLAILGTDTVVGMDKFGGRATGIQAYINVNPAADVTVPGTATGMAMTLLNQTPGPVDSMVGITLNSTNPGSGTITTNIGLLVGDQTVGATNYAIKTGAGRISLGDTIELYSTPPATAGSTGITGQFTWDNGFLYICVAPNTWLRSAATTWV